MSERVGRTIGAGETGTYEIDGSVEAFNADGTVALAIDDTVYSLSVAGETVSLDHDLDGVTDVAFEVDRGDVHDELQWAVDAHDGDLLVRVVEPGTYSFRGTTSIGGDRTVALIVEPDVGDVRFKRTDGDEPIDTYSLTVEERSDTDDSDASDDETDTTEAETETETDTETDEPDTETETEN